MTLLPSSSNGYPVVAVAFSSSLQSAQASVSPCSRQQRLRWAFFTPVASSVAGHDDAGTTPRQGGVPLVEPRLLVHDKAAAMSLQATMRLALKQQGGSNAPASRGWQGIKVGQESWHRGCKNAMGEERVFLSIFSDVLSWSLKIVIWCVVMWYWGRCLSITSHKYVQRMMD